MQNNRMYAMENIPEINRIVLFHFLGVFLQRIFTVTMKYAIKLHLNTIVVNKVHIFNAKK